MLSAYFFLQIARSIHFSKQKNHKYLHNTSKWAEWNRKRSQLLKFYQFSKNKKNAKFHNLVCKGEYSVLISSITKIKTCTVDVLKQLLRFTVLVFHKIWTANRKSLDAGMKMVMAIEGHGDIIPRSRFAIEYSDWNIVYKSIQTTWDITMLRILKSDRWINSLKIAKAWNLIDNVEYNSNWQRVAIAAAHAAAATAATDDCSQWWWQRSDY